MENIQNCNMLATLYTTILHPQQSGLRSKLCIEFGAYDNIKCYGARVGQL